MGGGLMQLVAYGAQDIYLTGNPQITFFKVVYRRHTNFSMEAIEQTINGSSTLSTTAVTNGTVTISRNGDLVHNVYVTSSGVTGITDGDDIVSEVELEIGGQRIDKHYKEWNQIWNELSTPESKAVALKAMKGSIGSSGSSGATGVGMVQVPLNFWFCRNPGLALPLIALQYHEVKLKFTFGFGCGAAAAVKVMVDYIYLDTDERRRFAQQSHEYLIEQLQRQNDTAATSMKLNFNHPVKELIWTSSQDYVDAKLTLNGHDRFAKQEEEYFQLRQPYDHHTAVPRQNLPTAAQVFKLGLADHTLSASSLGPVKTQANVACSTAIYSLGDRAPTAKETGTGAASAGEVGLAHFSNGTLTLAADDFTTTLSDIGFSEGGQIAIIITPGGVAHVAADAVLSTGASSAGQVFFATVTSAVAVADLLTLSITPPTLSGGTATITTLADATSGTVNVAAAAATQVGIFLVSSNTDSAARTSKMTNNVNVYSFALKPEEHQPSGTCNFSRIDTAKLEFNTAPAASGSINVYAVNYNVLRIMSGMGGLAYSN
jgi:hypothetical protein